MLGQVPLERPQGWPGPPVPSPHPPPQPCTWSLPGLEPPQAGLTPATVLGRASHRTWCALPQAEPPPLDTQIALGFGCRSLGEQVGEGGGPWPVAAELHRGIFPFGRPGNEHPSGLCHQGRGFHPSSLPGPSLDKASPQGTQRPAWGVLMDSARAPVWWAWPAGTKLPRKAAGWCRLSEDLCPQAHCLLS